MEENEKRNLIFCGDIHGEFKELVHKLVVKYQIENSDIIILGDIGVGFEKKGFYDHIYNNQIRKRLEKNNITIYAIRGNHDDPKYFDGTYDYERFKFIPDHEIFNIGDLKIYPVGGATSIDQDWRKEAMIKKPEQILWWENEEPIKKYQDLPGKVDIIISHAAPLTFDPITTREDDMSLEVWEKSLETRKYLDHILKEVKAEYWFHGHYHKSSSGDYRNLKYRGLSIMELYQYNY